MNEVDLSGEVKRWLRYASEDLHAAEWMLEESDMIPRHACWLAQQAAEKALKAVLVFLKIDFPWTHDLDALRNLIPNGWQLKARHPDLADLSDWATEARYPGDLPDAVESDARAAVERARAVWTSVCDDFGEHGFEGADVS